MAVECIVTTPQVAADSGEDKKASTVSIDGEGGSQKKASTIAIDGDSGSQKKAKVSKSEISPEITDIEDMTFTWASGDKPSGSAVKSTESEKKIESKGSSLGGNGKKKMHKKTIAISVVTGNVVVIGGITGLILALKFRSPKNVPAAVTAAPSSRTPSLNFDDFDEIYLTDKDTQSKLDVNTRFASSVLFSTLENSIHVDAVQHFLGFTSQTARIFDISDVFVVTSIGKVEDIEEGLNVMYAQIDQIAKDSLPGPQTDTEQIQSKVDNLKNDLQRYADSMKQPNKLFLLKLRKFLYFGSQIDAQSDKLKAYFPHRAVPTGEKEWATFPGLIDWDTEPKLCLSDKRLAGSHKQCGVVLSPTFLGNFSDPDEFRHFADTFNYVNDEASKICSLADFTTFNLANPLLAQMEAHPDKFKLAAEFVDGKKVCILDQMEFSETVDRNIWKKMVRKIHQVLAKNLPHAPRYEFSV